MRIRIVFEKLEEMRFTGHLDLFKTWERTFRRANLQVTYSQGFTPRPRVNIGAALPLGFTGENELMDIWLDVKYTLEEVQEKLNPTLPPGLFIKSVHDVEPESPSLQALISASEYRITFPELVSKLQLRLIELMNQKEIWRERRKKSYNLRPLIIDLYDIQPADDSFQQVKMRLLAKEGATGRPDEVLLALGIDPHKTRIHRLKLILN